MRPDFTNKNSFHNWVEELDLYCTPQAKIGMLGSFLFAGILFSMFFIIPLSDKYGRKPMLILNAALGTVVQGAFLLYYDLYFFYFLMFLMGVAAALNPCVGYVYILEVVSKQHEAKIITLSQIGEGIPTLIGPLYFMFVSS